MNTQFGLRTFNYKPVDTGLLPIQSYLNTNNNLRLADVCPGTLGHNNLCRHTHLSTVFKRLLRLTDLKGAMFWQ